MKLEGDDGDVIAFDKWGEGEIKPGDEVINVWRQKCKTDVYRPSRVIHVEPYKHKGKKGRLIYVTRQEPIEIPGAVEVRS